MSSTYKKIKYEWIDGMGYSVEEYLYAWTNNVCDITHIYDKDFNLILTSSDDSGITHPNYIDAIYELFHHGDRCEDVSMNERNKLSDPSIRYGKNEITLDSWLKLKNDQYGLNVTNDDLEEYINYRIKIKHTDTTLISESQQFDEQIKQLDELKERVKNDN